MCGAFRFLDPKEWCELNHLTRSGSPPLPEVSQKPSPFWDIHLTHQTHSWCLASVLPAKANKPLLPLLLSRQSLCCSFAILDQLYSQFPSLNNRNNIKQESKQEYMHLVALSTRWAFLLTEKPTTWSKKTPIACTKLLGCYITSKIIQTKKRSFTMAGKYWIHWHGKN